MPQLRELHPSRELSVMVETGFSGEYMHLFPPLLDGVDVPEYIHRLVETRQNPYERPNYPLLTIEQAYADVAAMEAGEAEYVRPATIRNDELWELSDNWLEAGQLFWHVRENWRYFTHVKRNFDICLDQETMAAIAANYRHYLKELPASLAVQVEAWLGTMPEIDPTEPVDLFDNVEIHDGGEVTTIAVPPRVIRTKKFGALVLDVFGKDRTPKERLDYGSHRFTPKGEEYWFPHAFPCEDIDPLLHTPDILDRERVEVTITLGNPYHYTPKELLAARIFLGTPSDTVTLLPDTMQFIGEQGYGRQVEYHEFDSERQADQHRVMENEETGEVPFPWVGNAPRQLWIPVDILRTGKMAVQLFSDDLDIPRSI